MAYSKSVLKKNRLALLQGIVLSGLYTFVFFMIQLEEYALLVGSIGLFVILAITMFLTRKVDWYEIGSKGEEKK
jgi:inner membrane protein